MKCPMNKLIPIPREQLEQLLKDAASTQTVEQFISQSALQAAIQTDGLYKKRAKAAQWSRLWLFASALFSVGSFIFSPNPEDALAGILLTGMTVMEFKVHSWFLHADPRGPLWGYRNQCLFAILFLLYGTYHCVVPAPSRELAELAELGDGDLVAVVQKLELVFYATVGLVGALGQYLLALYYRRAAKVT